MVFMEDHEKEYAFTIRLGRRTETDDADGKPLEERDASGVTREAVEAALASFRGSIRQRPPSFSAVKVEGRRAYQLARQGKVVEIPEREVTVHELRIVKFDPPRVDCVMRCSKGTYVRSVARDLGDALGVGGSVAALRRTASGPFRVEQALRLGDEPSILPLDAGIGHLPRIDLDADGARLFCTGRLIDLKLADPLVRAYHDGRFLGIGEPKDGRLKARLVIS
jgi:tRNA pseudouridine55 synthase